MEPEINEETGVIEKINSDAMQGTVRDRKTGGMKKRQKAKPMWMMERDKEVIRLMTVLQDAELVANKVNAKVFMNGRKKISKRRVYQIVANYRDTEAEGLVEVNINELIADAKNRYNFLWDEAAKMLATAALVKDPTAKIKAQTMASEAMRKSQKGLDDLYKACGIYREQKDYNVNINIRETDDWLRLEEVFMMFLKYGLMETYGVSCDPMVWLNFVERTENDPIFLQSLKNRVTEEAKEGAMGCDAIELMNEMKIDAIDVKYTNIGGEEGEYEGTVDIPKRVRREEDEDSDSTGECETSLE